MSDHLYRTSPPRWREDRSGYGLVCRFFEQWVDPFTALWFRFKEHNRGYCPPTWMHARCPTRVLESIGREN